MSKILIIGFGSIAQRHLKNIRLLKPEATIGVWRQHSHSSDLGEYTSLVNEIMFDQEDALAFNPDVVFVTNPSTRHCADGLLFAQYGAHVFFEKPLANTDEGLKELMDVVRSENCVAMVGYNIRFFQPFQIMKQAIDQGKIGKVLHVRASVGQYLPDWRPAQDYRTTVTANKQLGGGIVAELSHEIDYAVWFAGRMKEVRAVTGGLSDLDIDVEDVADIVLTTENGTFVNIHLDMIDRIKNRSCRIVGSEGTLWWDAHDGSRVSLYQAQTQATTQLFYEENIDFNQMYIDEIAEFFQCIDEQKMPSTSLADGEHVVKIIDGIHQSVRTGKLVTL